MEGEELAGEESRNAAIFVQDKFSFANGIAIIPGIRYESVELDSAVTDNTFDDVTGALALEYQATDNFLLCASSTQLFKAPELSEVFIGAGLYDTRNPELEAEQSHNDQVSFAFQNSIFGADRFTTGITLFRTHIENHIYDYTIAGKNNVGNMDIEGYAAYLGYDLDDLEILLTYSSAESDLSAFADYAALDGARIDRQQGDSLSLDIDYTFASPGLSLPWDSLVVKDIARGLDLDGATLDNAKEGYAVHNVSVKWTPTSAEGLILTLGVDNLFDKFYASQSSRTGTSFHPRFGQLYLMDYEPGRNLKLTASYNF